MSSTASTLQSTVAAITERLDRQNAVRDRALADGRQIVRLSANSVRAVHRGDFSDARDLLAQASALLKALVETLTAFPAILWAGYVQDAMKEFAEAHLTLAIVAGEPLPGPEQLGVADPPYLNALAEGASELRRQVLDRLRADDVDRAVALLAWMDDIYDLLVTVDFPDAVTGGLRRTTDQLRAVLERTRGDVTMTLTQRRLRTALAAAGLSSPSLDPGLGDADSPTAG